MNNRHFARLFPVMLALFFSAQPRLFSQGIAFKVTPAQLEELSKLNAMNQTLIEGQKARLETLNLQLTQALAQLESLREAQAEWERTQTELKKYYRKSAGRAAIKAGALCFCAGLAAGTVAALVFVR